MRLAAAAMWCTGWCGDVALAVWGVPRFWALQQEWWHAVGGRQSACRCVSACRVHNNWCIGKVE